MSVEWTDAEREAVRGALLVDLDVPRVTTEDVDAVLAALAPFVAAREAQAAARALHQVADDLESITHGRHSEGIKGWPPGDQNIYELAIEEASVKIHDRADGIEQGES